MKIIFEKGLTNTLLYAIIDNVIKGRKNYGRLQNQRQF